MKDMTKKLAKTGRNIKAIIITGMEAVIAFTLILFIGGFFCMSDKIIQILKQIVQLYKDFYFNGWSKETFCWTIFATIFAVLVANTLFKRNKKD